MKINDYKMFNRSVENGTKYNPYLTFRNGTLHLMSGVCALVTKAELEYWGIDELLLEPCCALKYYPEIELCCKGEHIF